MRVIVNGDSMELTEASTLTDLLVQLKLKPELVVVELNLSILNRQEYPQMALKAGDQVEIVQIVGGGSSAGFTDAPRGQTPIGFHRQLR